jgi:acyl-coenzyme A synthetase/AMP-(fatty) acid ligase
MNFSNVAKSFGTCYGPTETTIYATGCRVAKGDGKITVGKPLTNYQAYVLDHNRKRVPVGAIGELYLGGIGAARGYLNRPELTRERFIEHPFSGCQGNLYRTGDLSRFLPNGEIELLGRTDNQVKLRGCRIELEEIEALLDSHPNVRKSVAHIIDFGEGDQRLPPISFRAIPQTLTKDSYASLPSGVYRITWSPPHSSPCGHSP